jgi:hypothetical protein
VAALPWSGDRRFLLPCGGGGGFVHVDERLNPHRWAVLRDVWGQLFDSAEDEIGGLVYSEMFIVDDPGLLALFRAKATQG